MVRPLSEKCRFRKHFDSQHVKTSQILAKTPWERFYHAFWSIWGKSIWKMSPLVLSEFWGVFVNTLNAAGKYPVQYCKNFQLPIQMQLSEKRKTFSQFFVPFLESRSNLKHLGKKLMVKVNMIPKLQTVKNFVTTPCKKCCFGTRLDSQHVKVSRILEESTWECFYHVFLSF